MTEQTYTREDMARILNNAGWTCSGAHEPGNYDLCDDCRETCLEVAGVVIRALPKMLARAWDEGFVRAVASMTVYRTSDRSGLIPNPYREQEKA